MMTFVLVVPSGRSLDAADSPNGLDFSKLDGHLHYGVSVCFGDSADPYEPSYLIATVDLTGCEAQADWTARQLCDEIDSRRAFPGFEDEVKSAKGPLIAFGKPDIDSNGNIV